MWSKELSTLRSNGAYRNRRGRQGICCPLQESGRRILLTVLLAACSLWICEYRTAASEFYIQASTGRQQQVSIKFVASHEMPERVVVEVNGLDAAVLNRLEKANWELPQWQQLFSLHAGPEDPKNDQALPAVLGAYSVSSGVLRFTPQFPLEPGVKYRAVFRPSGLPGRQRPDTESISASFSLPLRKNATATVVNQVYPSADVLPENLLKFYIYFSAPMSRGRIYDHIHLYGSTGKEVDKPFLEIDEELWDHSMTRLTLLIDPGRIKRGVQPLEETGPVLEAGEGFILMIAREWKDAAGNPLKEDFQKQFQVGPADREAPDPANWAIQAPKAGGRQPLVILFPEPLDHALAQRLIRVMEEPEIPIEGNVTLEDNERRWVFVPNKPWQRGSYSLQVLTMIEDIAGNNIGRPFDMDVLQRLRPRLSAATIKLPFAVR